MRYKKNDRRYRERERLVGFLKAEEVGRVRLRGAQAEEAWNLIPSRNTVNQTVLGDFIK